MDKLFLAVVVSGLLVLVTAGAVRPFEGDRHAPPTDPRDPPEDAP